MNALRSVWSPDDALQWRHMNIYYIMASGITDNSTIFHYLVQTDFKGKKIKLRINDSLWGITLIKGQ